MKIGINTRSMKAPLDLAAREQEPLKRGPDQVENMRSNGSAQRLVYRREGDHWLIEIRLRELRQLFHHLDPAPFREKDLDPDAAVYIEDAVRELGRDHPAKLIVHLPGAAGADDEIHTLPEAIANYYQYRARQTRVELRQLLRRALVNLAIALLFLFACLTLRGSLAARGSSEVLTEGLLIIGWVALWRPVEMFLYDWWPLLRRARRLEATARMPVEVRCDLGAAPAAHAG